jgi:hypothetical protein
MDVRAEQGLIDGRNKLTDSFLAFLFAKSSSAICAVLWTCLSDWDAEI